LSAAGSEELVDGKIVEAAVLPNIQGGEMEAKGMEGAPNGHDRILGESSSSQALERIREPGEMKIQLGRAAKMNAALENFGILNFTGGDG
jgi:hypothetical protein